MRDLSIEEVVNMVEMLVEDCEARPRIAWHGTESGFRRHQRNGERPCRPCRLAENEAQRGYQRRQRERAK